MGGLSKEQEQFYRKTLEESKKQLEEIDTQMEKELQKIREKLADLQATKKSIRQIYDGAVKLLGVENEFASEEEEEKSPEVPAK
ncbi:MAG: hypothetical protein ACE5WD_08135 [Candidatus Aminicenantia bacterium]